MRVWCNIVTVLSLLYVCEVYGADPWMPEYWQVYSPPGAEDRRYLRWLTRYGYCELHDEEAEGWTYI